MHELQHVMAELAKAGMSPKDLQQMADRRNLLGENAPAPPNFKRVYKDPSIVNIPTGATFPVRFLGDIVTLWIHWEQGGGSVPCFGPDCRRCPDRRIQYGYAPAVCSVLGDRGMEMQIRVLCLQAQALPPLINENLRGWLVHFFRENKRKPPVVEIKDRGETAAANLPPSFDVRQCLMRRYGLTIWPAQDASDLDPDAPIVAIPEKADGSEILKFRKGTA